MIKRRIIKWSVTVCEVWFTFWWFHFNANNDAWYNWATWITSIIIWFACITADTD